jgi:hypothetical protein
MWSRQVCVAGFIFVWVARTMRPRTGSPQGVFLSLTPLTLESLTHPHYFAVTTVQPHPYLCKRKPQANRLIGRRHLLVASTQAKTADPCAGAKALKPTTAKEGPEWRTGSRCGLGRGDLPPVCLWCWGEAAASFPAPEQHLIATTSAAVY